MSQPEANEPATGPMLGDFSKPTYDDWRALAEEQLGGAPFDKKLVTQTPEGIPVQPIYNSDDLQGLPHLNELPGFGSYARGATSSEYLSQPWFIAQELPYSTPEEFNQVAQNDLSRGQSALNILLDIATAYGKDPDQAKDFEVGACGLSLSMIQDFEAALKDVHLEMLPLYIQSGIGAVPMAAMVYALLRKRGQSPAVLNGGFDMDPLSVLVRSGNLPISLDQACAEMAMLVKYESAHAPGLRAVGVSGSPYADGGAGATQELGFALGSATEYLRRLLDAGIEINPAAQSFRFTFSAGADFFMTIAKLRAARILWSRIVEAFGGNAESRRMALHVRTGLWNKTHYDPYVNMLRVTTEAFSGVAGGADSLHSGAFDEVLRVPDRFSRRIGRNTQIVLQEECDLTRIIDPAGGSYYIEKLTDDVAKAAWEIFQKVEADGGMFAALQNGWPQEQVIETRKKRQDRLAQRRDVLVGTNMYANVTEKPLEEKIPDYEKLKDRRSRQISEYRVSGETAADNEILETLNKLVEVGDDEKFDLMIQAAQAGASVGELTNSLRANASEPVKVKQIPFERAAAPYERMRQAVETLARGGERVKVFLLNIGPLVNHKIRADFSRAFFEPAGVDVIYPDGFDDMEDAADAAEQSGSDIVVICGTDKDYPEIVPKAVQAVKARTPEMITVLAGYPGEHEAAYKEAGLDDYIFIKTNNYEFLKDKLTRLNVL